MGVYITKLSCCFVYCHLFEIEAITVFIIRVSSLFSSSYISHWYIPYILCWPVVHSPETDPLKQNTVTITETAVTFENQYIILILGFTGSQHGLHVYSFVLCLPILCHIVSNSNRAGQTLCIDGSGCRGPTPPSIVLLL